MSEFKGTPWLVEIIEPDYLDGILSGVTVYGNERRPVAYAFDEAEGRVLAAAPEMAAELREARLTIGIARTQIMVELNRGVERWDGVPEALKLRLDAIDAVLAKALGEGQ